MPKDVVPRRHLSVVPDGKPRLNPKWHYHLLGIGGIGMSAVAEMMHRRGIRVSGSDSQDGPIQERLRGLGIPVALGHGPECLGDADAVIFTPAVGTVHPIWDEISRRNLPRLHRVEALAALTADATTVAVSGTHGKTTTTAALGMALISAGVDPTVLVGGQVAQFEGSNVRVGRGRWWITEADESDGSFLRLSPHAILVTNIEADHLDHHGSLDKIEAVFRSFVGRLDAKRGVLVACADDPLSARLFHPGRTVTYGTSAGATVQVQVRSMQPGAMDLEISQGGRHWEFTSKLVGRHNAVNLAGAFAMALALDLPEGRVIPGLASFTGVERRQTYVGNAAGLQIFDDYAHHPTEIRATLDLFRSVYGGPITVVFQPHLYSRTQHFAEQFAEALRSADRVYVTDVYAAREAPIAGVSGRLISDKLTGSCAGGFVPTWQELVPRLLHGEAPEGILLTLGAGDITGLGPQLVRGGAR